MRLQHFIEASIKFWMRDSLFLKLHYEQKLITQLIFS